MVPTLPWLGLQLIRQKQASPGWQEGAETCFYCKQSLKPCLRRSQKEFIFGKRTEPYSKAIFSGLKHSLLLFYHPYPKFFNRKGTLSLCGQSGQQLVLIVLDFFQFVLFSRQCLTQPGLAWTCFAAKYDLGPFTLRPLPHKCWDYRRNGHQIQGLPCAVWRYLTNWLHPKLFVGNLAGGWREGGGGGGGLVGWGGVGWETSIIFWSKGLLSLPRPLSFSILPQS